MYCPRCTKKVSALSTKCPHCTADYSTGDLWDANIMGWGLIAAVVVILVLIGAAA